MQQPKAVIRPTGLVEIPIQSHMGSHTNYGFNASLYPPPNYDQQEMAQLEISKQSSLSQSQAIHTSEVRQGPEQCYMDRNLHQNQTKSSNITPATDISQQRQVLQSQVVIVQSGKQIQAGYPVQGQPAKNFPLQVTNLANPQANVSSQRPPMIVQPGRLTTIFRNFLQFLINDLFL